MNVRLTKLAARDVLARTAWLVERSPAAASAFRQELDAALDLILQTPDAGQIVRLGAPRGEVRRWLLPPMVIYFAQRGDELVVYRVRHSARRPIER